MSIQCSCLICLLDYCRSASAIYSTLIGYEPKLGLTAPTQILPFGDVRRRLTGDVKFDRIFCRDPNRALATGLSAEQLRQLTPQAASELLAQPGLGTREQDALHCRAGQRRLSARPAGSTRSWLQRPPRADCPLPPEGEGNRSERNYVNLEEESHITHGMFLFRRALNDCAGDVDAGVILWIVIVRYIKNVLKYWHINIYCHFYSFLLDRN